MKLLNNKGWGLATLIGFICVLAVFLVVISFLISNFNKNENKESYINYINI